MTSKRIAFLQQLLDFVGIEGRLHLEWISSAEAQRFVQVVTSFTERVRFMGPNPLAGLSEKFRDFVLAHSDGFQGPAARPETPGRIIQPETQPPALH